MLITSGQKIKSPPFAKSIIIKKINVFEERNQMLLFIILNKKKILAKFTLSSTNEMYDFFDRKLLDIHINLPSRKYKIFAYYMNENLQYVNYQKEFSVKIQNFYSLF